MHKGVLLLHSATKQVVTSLLLSDGNIVTRSWDAPELSGLPSLFILLLFSSSSLFFAFIAFPDEPCLSHWLIHRPRLYSLCIIIIVLTKFLVLVQSYSSVPLDEVEIYLVTQQLADI